MSNERIEISERIIKFSGRIIKLVNVIANSSAGKKIADQLVRCGTSVGANYEEAHGEQSRVDLISPFETISTSAVTVPKDRGGLMLKNKRQI